MSSGTGGRVLMLRGINLGPTRRVPMAELRALLTEAGYGDVRTYVQSGNVVLTSDLSPPELEAEAERLISERFGFDVPAVVRSQQELAEVVKRNPLQDVADNPKRYQVSFLRDELDPAVGERLMAALVPPEALVIDGRHLYAWHPAGVARSKLWNAVAGTGLGTVATARNWTTVTTLLEMAGG